MAASQARFLALTARKTNVEYEGQQINQQRTALANQSANYYNNLLGMSVPVPPSVDNFTKTVYTFEDGALTNSITALMPQATPTGTYKVSYLKQYVDEFSPVAANTSIVTKDGSDYKVGADTLRELGALPTGVTATSPDTDSYSGTDPRFQGLTHKEIRAIIEEEVGFEAALDAKYGTSTSSKDYFTRYIKNSTTGEMIPYFYKKTDLAGASYDANGHSLSNVPCYTMGKENKISEEKNVSARVEQDSTGRLINITLNPDDPNKAVTYALTTNTITDQAAYDDAMNQYEYTKYEYDQAIQNINSKISIIQNEDKNLELRMKQ
ncbi:MAG: hypothetical protein LBJ74_04370, partial [Heliobacteriaceae bacterium]|nr:hypothetical protein [Heliobacteriaceae bacterium]